MTQKEPTRASKATVLAYCPACGYGLNFLPWENNSPADEICSSCGIQFGYDDAAGGDIVKRKQMYLVWREKWVSNSCKWQSSNPPPKGWGGEEQLRKFLNNKIVD